MRFRIHRADGKCLLLDGWGQEMWVPAESGWFISNSEESVRSYFRRALAEGCELETENVTTFKPRFTNLGTQVSVTHVRQRDGQTVERITLETQLRLEETNARS